MHTLFINLLDLFYLSTDEEEDKENTQLKLYADGFKKASKLLSDIDNILLDEKKVSSCINLDNTDWVIRLKIQTNKKNIEKILESKLLNGFLKKTYDHEEEDYHADENYNSC